MERFFVTCPAYITTGGVELLHQLVYKLNQIRKDCAVIYYVNFNKKNQKHPTSEIYMKYTEGKFVTKIIDNKEQILILPEIYTHLIPDYNKIKIVIWWLSVDNFNDSVESLNSAKKNSYKEYIKGKKYLLYKLLNYINIKPDYYFNPFNRKALYNKKIIFHSYQSEYARLFLEKNNLGPAIPLSDFLNKTFFKDENTAQNREDIILYNPKKGFQITKELIAFMTSYEWIPLENFTHLEMRDLMKKSKIYIDFGNHPGKDRIPREATINGCVVVTNKKGAAGNCHDIAINQEYKFKDPITDKEDFKKLIDNIFLDFQKHFQQFDSYRAKIKNEEMMFEKELLIFYNKCLKQ